jgi:hypothetical protein
MVYGEMVRGEMQYGEITRGEMVCGEMKIWGIVLFPTMERKVPYILFFRGIYK